MTDERERTWREAAARLGELEATVAAQQSVISTLVTAAEAPGESVTRLGTQHVVERRVARLHQAERVLRSVIESLEGALCIVSEDGTILDANGRWLRMIMQSEPQQDGVRPLEDGGGHGGDDPGKDSRAERPGTVGSDFFSWCRTAQGMQELLADLQPMVREVVETGSGGPMSAADPTVPLVPPERSVKGQVGPEDNRHWVVARVHFVRDHALARAVVTITDITGGMQTQLQLRRATEEAQRLALVAKATHSAIVITQPDGTVEWVNESFVQRSGFTLDEAVGRQRQDLVGPPRPGDSGLAPLLAEIAASCGGDGEYLLTSRSGDPYWASIEVRPVLEDGRVVHLVWVEQDVTARRLTQDRLSESMTRAEQLAEALSQEKTLLAGVISAVPQLVFWKDAQGRYVGCNTAYLDFRGLAREEDLLGHDEATLGLADSLAEAQRDLEAQVTATGEAIVNRTVDLVDGRGQLRTFLLSVLPHTEDAQGTRGVIGVGADITHARELERQLAQANRLESIGQLAAGIAHEINTPIQYVTGNVHFLTDVTGEILAAARLAAGPGGAGPGGAGTDGAGTGGAGTGGAAGPPGAGPHDPGPPDLELPDMEFLSREIPAALAACDEGLTRVADIVRAMKDYAHPGTGRTDIDVNRALESTVRVCRNEWKYVAQVQLDLAPDAGAAPCFEGELKQVVLNMIVNAAQAIGEDRTRRGIAELGTITVATRREPPHFVITITDDGPGMDEHVSRRAFDPFFTTKDVGKGTGQGLSLAHSVIVAKHGGRIDLQTTPGHGARFELYLPLTAPRPANPTDPTDEEREPS